MKECQHLKDRRITSTIWANGDRGYSIGGCCGTQCDVIRGIKFCPFCGVRLEVNKSSDIWFDGKKWLK